MSKALAEFFYEQCVGTQPGHMALLPNNPILFSLLENVANANTGGVTMSRNHHAMTKPEFAIFLRNVADTLDPEIQP